MLNYLAPAKSSADSVILTYHSLDTTGSVISTAPDLFRQQMEYLAESGADVVPLAALPNSPGSVALTFDDGFRNLQEYALPVLERLNLPATVFVVSGKCGGRNDWGSFLSTGVPSMELLSWSELCEVARAGVAIGGHSVEHRNLASLPDEQVASELRDCRRELEDRTGGVVETFAYPYGVSTATVRRLAGEHFHLACGTRLAFVTAGSDPLDLPRIDAYYLRRRFWLSNLHNRKGRAYIRLRRALREVSSHFRKDPV